MNLSRTAGASLGGFTAVLLAPQVSNAGMTMPRFTDVAAARLDVISFFLVGYLVLALLYRKLWNSLAKDFSWMPKLSYRGALGGLVVCGLFIYVVLTMISGARELMTPGAWARSGVFYKIREPEKEPKPWLDTARRISMENLRAELWRYAENNGGKLPRSQDTAGIAANLWRSIDPSGLRFVYFPGLKVDEGTNVIAYEPGTFGSNRFVLLTNGEVVQMDIGQLRTRINSQIEGTDAATHARITP